MSVFEIIYTILFVASTIFIINEYFFKLIIKIVMRFYFKNEKVIFKVDLVEKLITWAALTIIISKFIIF